MPLFQYFGWVGSFLLAALLAANWCFPAPLLRSLMFHSIRRSAFGSIRIIDGLSVWCWTRRARHRRKKHARRTALVEASLPLSRASLSPIRFTSRQEEADALAHESGQFAAQVFRALSHQSAHQHWEQDEIHENLRGCEASFRAEGAF